MQQVDKDAEYAGAQGAVLLDVVVGEGQTGSIAVRVEGTVVGSGDDELSGVELGPADALRGKTVRVTSVTSVVNPQSGRTSLACRFRSDAGPFEDVTGGPDLEVGKMVRFAVDYACR